MDNVIIFGAGKLGEMAGRCYKNSCNIVCYVDNDAKKWGTFLGTQKIVSPEILRDFKGKVVIAVQNDLSKIEAELKSKYGITHFLEFGVSQKGKFLEERQAFKGKCIVVEYVGGLGNQLFQYALARYLELKGCDVVADITHYAYLNTRKFELDRIFRNIDFRYASEETCEYYLLKEKVSKIEGSNEKYVYIEPDIAKSLQYTVSGEWGNVRRGILNGYFQTYLFADDIRETLLRGLEFPRIEDRKLHLLTEEMKRNNSVSIHIRRGDYLLEKERRMNGICDAQYYARAIEMIKESVANPYFYIFSDDILWCKENIRIDGAFYIDSGMFDDYEDWHDMYLMSQCKHNIIANSTFSWWGAWLNVNRDKIVIAPSKWDNFCNLTNVCPPAWSRI